MHTWKRCLSVLLSVALILAVLPAGLAAGSGSSIVISPQTVYFDGVEAPVSAYNIGGANYFKLRDIARLLSGSAAQFAIAGTNSMTISITTGSAYTPLGNELAGLSETVSSVVASSWKLIVDGISCDVAAYNIDGYNYYKLRDLGSAIGFTVGYDAVTDSVLITSQIPFQSEVRQSAAVNSSYFNDAVFVGDSISTWLQYYTGTAGLGDATFLIAGSFSIESALSHVTKTSVHPSYQGVKMKVEDAVVLSGSNKVYIMLGMNDIKNDGVDKAVDNYLKFINRILQQAPDVSIFVQSVTPLMDGSSTADDALSNDTVNEFNEAMKTACRENQWYYLDVASIYTGEDGSLIADDCSDASGMGIHITYSATSLWVDYLKTHVPAALQ